MKKMKVFAGGLLLVSLLVVCASVMTSCSKDDDEGDNGSIDKSLIVGTWECTHFEYWDKEDGKVVWTADADEFLGLTETFYANGICADDFFHWPEGEVTVYWFWGDNEGNKDNDGNRLWIDGVSNLTGGHNIEPFNIAPVVTLNSTTLIFGKHESETEDGVKYEYYVNVVFKRIK